MSDPSDPGHQLITRLATRIKALVEDEGGVNVQTNPNVETEGGDSIYVGGDVNGIPISVYVNTVPQ